MRFVMVTVATGIVRPIPYVECWRCGDDVLETELSLRDLCGRCERLAEDGFIAVTTDGDDNYY